MKLFSDWDKIFKGLSTYMVYKYYIYILKAYYLSNTMHIYIIGHKTLRFHRNATNIYWYIWDLSKKNISLRRINPLHLVSFFEILSLWNVLNCGLFYGTT